MSEIQNVDILSLESSKNEGSDMFLMSSKTGHPVVGHFSSIKKNIKNSGFQSKFSIVNEFEGSGLLNLKRPINHKVAVYGRGLSAIEVFNIKFLLNSDISTVSINGDCIRQNNDSGKKYISIFNHFGLTENIEECTCTKVSYDNAIGYSTKTRLNFSFNLPEDFVKDPTHIWFKTGNRLKSLSFIFSYPSGSITKTYPNDPLSYTDGTYCAAFSVPVGTTKIQVVCESKDGVLGFNNLSLYIQARDFIESVIGKSSFNNVILVRTKEGYSKLIVDRSIATLFSGKKSLNLNTGELYNEIPIDLGSLTHPKFLDFSDISSEDKLFKYIFTKNASNLILQGSEIGLFVKKKLGNSKRKGRPSYKFCKILTGASTVQDLLNYIPDPIGGGYYPPSGSDDKFPAGWHSGKRSRKLTFIRGYISMIRTSNWKKKRKFKVEYPVGTKVYFTLRLTSRGNKIPHWAMEFD